MGKEKRDELSAVYSLDSGLFSAEFIGGKIAEQENAEAYHALPEDFNSDFYSAYSYFPDLLSDMGFSIDNAYISFEYLPFDGQETGLYVIKPLAPAEPKGTVFFFHGYFDYAAKFSAWYQKLLDAGYAVITADLPGHGVSTGPRGEITEFGQYGDYVETVVTRARELGLPEPWFASGHSTGSASLVIYGLSRGETPFAALFLGSPLGRSRCYHPAVAGSVLLSPFIFAVKAQWSGDFSVNYVPLSWFRAQRRWVATHDELLKSQTPFSRTPVLLAWGGNDDTLDLKYSRGFFTQIFPEAVSETFPGAIHNLYIDDEQQEHVFDAAIAFFSLHYPR